MDLADIEQGEVLWITSDICRLHELPDGFALLVDEFFGVDYDRPDQRWVWVGGPVLLNARGATLRHLTVSVPVCQPRAVLINGALAPQPSQAVPSGPPPPAEERDGHPFHSRFGQPTSTKEWALCLPPGGWTRRTRIGRTPNF